jgi:outer membrane protein TolC
VILTLLVAAQVAAGGADSIPRVTLAEALQRSARLDPDYVGALGGVHTAQWGRLAALTAFVVPNVTLSTNVQRSMPGTFIPAAGTSLKTFVTASVTAQIDLFTGGQKIAAWQKARAELEGAHATELQTRFAAAVLTESDYYAALAAEELTRVATSRVRRAEEQLAVARARVASGAAVQTDSLQLLLELSRARVGLLRQSSSLRTSRLQLGRRIGVSGPVQPVPLDTTPARELPFTLDEAVRRALEQGPEYRIARANERSASADAWSVRGSYLPRASLSFTGLKVDTTFFPNFFKLSQWNLTVSLPIWNGGQREIALSRARAAHNVARAIRDDLERAGRRDVGEAYDAYETTRAEFTLAQSALAVAQENFRVQDTRYRSGATTILDLVDAQLSLAEAEAGMVQARYGTRLALAALEAILGQRLFSQETP